MQRERILGMIMMMGVPSQVKSKLCHKFTNSQIVYSELSMSDRKTSPAKHMLLAIKCPMAKKIGQI